MAIPYIPQWCNETSIVTCQVFVLPFSCHRCWIYSLRCPGLLGRSWGLSLRQTQSPCYPWCWRQKYVQQTCNSSLNTLYSNLGVLFLQEFVLCAQWVELYPVSDQLRLKLKTEHLLHLLEKGQTDEAFQVQTTHILVKLTLQSIL